MSDMRGHRRRNRHTARWRPETQVGEDDLATAFPHIRQPGARTGVRRNRSRARKEPAKRKPLNEQNQVVLAAVLALDQVGASSFQARHLVVATGLDSSAVTRSLHTLNGHELVEKLPRGWRRT